jgi:hypothetical protein
MWFAAPMIPGFFLSILILVTDLFSDGCEIWNRFFLPFFEPSAPLLEGGNSLYSF